MPKIYRKLSDREIREAKPKDKNYFLFDDGNLRLLVRPSSTKVWQYPYQFNEKNNTTLGKYGDRTGFVSLSDDLCLTTTLPRSSTALPRSSRH